MAKLIAALIRHGDYHQLADAPSAHQPFPLTAEGEDQARGGGRILREMLDRHGWRLAPVVDSSHMLRAWQTARIITEQLAGDAHDEPRVQSFDALAERGVGCVANLTVRQITDIIRQDPRYPDPPEDWKADSHYRLPLQGAESLMDAGRRVANHLVQRMARLEHEASGKDVLKLFVGHGAAFRHAAFHLGVLELSDIARFSMFHCRPIFLEYLGERGWRHIDGEWKLRAKGDDALD